MSVRADSLVSRSVHLLRQQPRLSGQSLFGSLLLSLPAVLGVAVFTDVPAAYPVAVVIAQSLYAGTVSARPTFRESADDKQAVDLERVENTPEQALFAVIGFVHPTVLLVSFTVLATMVPRQWVALTLFTGPLLNNVVARFRWYLSPFVWVPVATLLLFQLVGYLEEVSPTSIADPVSRLDASQFNSSSHTR